MSFDSVKALVDDDLREVDRVIRTRLASDVVLVNQIADYIVGGGGKRLRPLVVVVAGRACGCNDRRHTEAAAIIEFIHTATLLHDDVVDGSTLRRGRDTANEVWGNEASVLVGDYVYSRAFEMMVSLGSMRIMDVMASATNKIAEGEVLQLMNANDPETTEERYFEVIYRKTAKLFESGAQIAAILAGAPAAIEGAMTALRPASRHGVPADRRRARLPLGQRATRQEPRRRPGRRQADAASYICAAGTATRTSGGSIRRSIEQGSAAELAAITAAIESTGGLAYTARLARQEAALAIEALADLPDSAYKQALRELADFAVERNLLKRSRARRDFGV